MEETKKQDLKLNRYDLWIIDSDNKRFLNKSVPSMQELEKYMLSRKFKKLLKRIKSVEVLQIFDKVEDKE